MKIPQAVRDRAADAICTDPGSIGAYDPAVAESAVWQLGIEDSCWQFSFRISPKYLSKELRQVDALQPIFKSVKTILERDGLLKNRQQIKFSGVLADEAGNPHFHGVFTVFGARPEHQESILQTFQMSVRIDPRFHPCNISRLSPELPEATRDGVWADDQPNGYIRYFLGHHNKTLIWGSLRSVSAPRLASILV